MDVQLLLQRVRNDRFGPEHVDNRYALGWNACSRNIEALILRWWGDQRLETGITELVNAPALDLRVKHELTLGTVSDGPSTCALPVASQDTGAFTRGEK